MTWPKAKITHYFTDKEMKEKIGQWEYFDLVKLTRIGK